MFERAIGIDGCPSGWVAATRCGVVVGRTLAGLFDCLAIDPLRDVIAIDMPIGLADTGRRACDALARERLGTTRHSVFWTATRDAVHAPDEGLSIRQAHGQASTINKANAAKGVSIQGFHLFPKIREVEALLRQHPAFRDSVFEVHPELAFAHWNRDANSAPRPIAHPKKTGLGAHDRLALIFARYGRRHFDDARCNHTRSQVADDDIADAYACLYSGERIASGRHVSLPADPARDRLGLPMRIIY